MRHGASAHRGDGPRAVEHSCRGLRLLTKRFPAKGTSGSPENAASNKLKVCGHRVMPYVAAPRGAFSGSCTAENATKVMSDRAQIVIEGVSHLYRPPSGRPVLA